MTADIWFALWREKEGLVGGVYYHSPLGPWSCFLQSPSASLVATDISSCAHLCPAGRSKGLRMLVQGCRPAEVYDIFLPINELIFHSKAASGNKNISRSGRQ